MAGLAEACTVIPSFSRKKTNNAIGSGILMTLPACLNYWSQLHVLTQEVDKESLLTVSEHCSNGDNT